MRKAFALSAAAALFAILTGCSGGARGTFEEFVARWAKAKSGTAEDLIANAELLSRMHERTLNALTQGMVSSVMGASLEVESVTAGPGEDEVTIEATQLVRFNPPGVESAMRASMEAEFHHVATLWKTSEGWRVTKFQPELVTTRETE